MQLKSALCVPLSTGTRVIGTLSLLATERHYGNADVELMTEIARRSAAAIESDRTRARTQMLFEASPTPMWVYDFETLRFLAVNDATVERYGYSRERVPRRDDDQGHPPAGGGRAAARRHQQPRRRRLARGQGVAPPARATAR